MADLTLDRKKREFEENFKKMNDSANGREVYRNTFLDQSRAENLLASGGGEQLGDLNTELASISAMNDIRASERKMAFTQDSLFAEDVTLGMRDASYVEATAELQRRKKIKSHRYDKTRRRRMATSRESLSKANDKIRALKKNPQGAEAMTSMQRIEAMKEIYDQIRIADRNCAEAMALNKDEEKKLKDKAELTYCKSMKKLFARELAMIPANSPEAARIRSLDALNERLYEQLTKSEIAQQEQEQVEEALRDLNRRDNVNEHQEQKLLDEQAEATVSANIKVFKNFNSTLNDEKYGNILEENWSAMKAAAASLMNGWEQKTDYERGDALAELLVSANKLLSREGEKDDTDNAREAAAKEFRSFFKSVIESMSINCRVLALEKVFKKVDELEDDPGVSEELKEANRSVFTEMARDRYRKRFPNTPENEPFLDTIDDYHYRLIYAEEKIVMHRENVDKIFINTSKYKLASFKFDFNRIKFGNMIADDFRLDRFGNVLPEDEAKKQQWETMIGKIADADQEKAKEIIKECFLHTAAKPADPEWTTEKGLKRHAYEYKAYSNSILNLQNFATDWKVPARQDWDKEIDRWNAAHPNDTIQKEKMENYRINKNELRMYGKSLEMLPAIKERALLSVDMDTTFMIAVLNEKGLKWGSSLDFFGPADMRTFYSIKKFVTDQNVQASYNNNLPWIVELVHEDGTDLDQEEDLDDKGRLIHHEQNRLVFRHERMRPQIRERINKLKSIGYLKGHENIDDSLDRVNFRIKSVTDVETRAMDRLRDLARDKGDPAELNNIETIYNNYLKELNVQAYAREALFQADIDSIYNNRSGYIPEVEKYFRQMKRINDLFDSLEKAREDLIVKTAGEAALSSWKDQLLQERVKAREAIEREETKGLSLKERVKRRCALELGGVEAERFTDEEYRQIENNYQNPNASWNNTEQRTRVADVFLMRVNRDFSGAYLTEKDRERADFNKRYKKAMTEGRLEEVKSLSREFTEKELLTHDQQIDPDELERLDLEGFERTYINSGLIQYRLIYLSMISNVNHASNTNFPELKTGLEELRARDPQRYASLEKKLSYPIHPVFTNIMNANGFDMETGMPVNIEGDVNPYELTLQPLVQMYRDALQQN